MASGEAFFWSFRLDQTKTRLWFAQACLEEGWARRVRLTIQDGRIAAIDTEVEPGPEDERHAVALPGMPNLHSHAFQRAIAGLTEWRGQTGDNFWSWRDRMYRFLERIGPDEMQAIATLAYMEMLEAGYTRVGEFHYVHNDLNGQAYAAPAEMAARLVAAAQSTGLGLTLLPVFYAHSDFGGAPPKPGQQRFVKSLDAFEAVLSACRTLTTYDDAQTGIAPHSLRAVTPHELQRLLEMSPSGPVHIHAAEQTGEVEACLAHYGARPVEWLLDKAGVGARWCLVHATHMTAEEISGLAGTAAVAGLCPLTEANLGDGIFPAPEYLHAGGAFGIGSDSLITISVAQELRMLEYSQRLSRRQRNVLAGWRIASTGGHLYRAVVTGGAQALGVTGHLKVGHAADIVSLDAGHVNFHGRQGDDLLDAHIFANASDAVDCVWRFGRKCVTGGRHRDREAIVRAYRVAMEQMTA